MVLLDLLTSTRLENGADGWRMGCRSLLEYNLNLT